jgi:hypothetical protein
VYATAAGENPDYAEKVRQHLEAAVDLGWPRSAIEGSDIQQRYQNEAWFVRLLERCRLERETSEELRRRYVTPPNRNQIMNYLTSPLGRR